ncbi:MAG: hypothetical protein ABSC56_08360 [Solirubrobacteraceae bacterium]|jgi:hypothetical protein
METSTSSSSDDPFAEILEAAAALRSARAAGDAPAVEVAFGRIAEATIRAFAASAREHERSPLPESSKLTATDVAVTCSYLLAAADLEVFELALWRSWVGRGSQAQLSPTQMAPGELG